MFDFLVQVVATFIKTNLMCKTKVVIGTLEELESQRHRPSINSLASLVKQSGEIKSLSLGKRVHALIVKFQHRHLVTFVSNLLIRMYAQCRSLSDSKLVFDSLQERNVFSWTILVAAYAQSGFPEEASIAFRKMAGRDMASWNTLIASFSQVDGTSDRALQLFCAMNLEGLPPNERTLVSVSSSCLVSHHSSNLVGSIAEESNAVTSSVNVANAMISMHARCGRLEQSGIIFRSMQRQRRDDLVSWNSIIGAHADAGNSDEALALYRAMLVEGIKVDRITMVTCLQACESSLISGKLVHGHTKSARLDLDPKVCTAVITMYGRCGGSLNEAKAAFETLLERGTGSGDVVLWTAMLGVYLKEQQHRDGIALFRRMDLEGVAANETTLSGVLDACSSLQDLETGRIIHKEIAMNENLDSSTSVVLGTALLDMYAKCGDLEAAKLMFDSINTTNTVTWNAMAAAYAAVPGLDVSSNTCDDALTLCREMELQGIRPDQSTVVSFLAICSHRGHVRTGLSYMSRLPSDYGFDPTPLHSACVVDLLARLGSLDEALVACSLSDDVLGWLALLSSCKSHDDAARGTYAAAEMLAANPDHGSTYVLLSTIYQAVGFEGEEILFQTTKTT